MFCNCVSCTCLSIFFVPPWCIRYLLTYILCSLPNIYIFPTDIIIESEFALPYEWYVTPYGLPAIWLFRLGGMNGVLSNGREIHSIEVDRGYYPASVSKQVAKYKA